jgi:hypothetical protein
MGAQLWLHKHFDIPWLHIYQFVTWLGSDCASSTYKYMASVVVSAATQSRNAPAVLGGVRLGLIRRGWDWKRESKGERIQPLRWNIMKDRDTMSAPGCVAG